MTEPRVPDSDPAQQSGRWPPEYVIVTWASRQLRDRIQRTGMSLAEALQAGHAQEPAPQADLEAEP